MKLFTLRPIVCCLSVGIVFAATSLVSAEFIVGSQVVSDEVAAPGTTPDSYAGDIPADGSVIDGGVVGGGGLVPGDRTYGQHDLFYNYYTQGNANRANAQMYLSPQPVPPNVGHTFYTYQPLYPEEYLYWHKNKFHNYYDNGRGMNRTRAVYYAPPARTAISNFYWNKIRLPR